MEKEISEPKLSVKCSLCNTSSNIITDQESQEMICNNCGSIINFKILYEKIQFNFPNKENINFNDMAYRAPSVLSRHDMGLSTVIGKTNRDASGQQIDIEMRNRIGRLRILDIRSQLLKHKERNLFLAFINLQILKDQIGLTDAVIEKAAYIYRKIREKKLAKGLSIKLAITTALYIACRDLEIPRTLKEISEISNTDEKKISKFYRTVLFELDLKIPQADPFKMIVKIANMCNISEKTKRYALKLMDELINKKMFTSRDPMGMAGAIVYMACKKNGEHIIQYQIANATGITIITLRKNLRFLEDYLR
jgi:transcription initiation factor TFIIB